jgi:ComEC/Rec2-related protein
MYRNAGHHKRRKYPPYDIIIKLLEEAGKYYYIIWAALFGLGLFVGMETWEKVSLPGYVQYSIIILMFLILGGSLFNYIREPGNNGNQTRRKELLLLVLIPATIFFMCGYLTQAVKIKPVNVVQNNSYTFSQDIRIRGRISSHPEIIFGSMYMDMVLESSDHKVFKKGDAISVILKRPGLRDICRDDILDIAGEIKVRKDKLVLEARSVENVFITDKSPGAMAFKLRQRLYKCISGAFSNYLKTEYAALAKALILGDRRYISEGQYGIFKQSGTAHIIAISGMHISFLAVIIFLVLEKIFGRSVLLPPLASIILFYNFILGPAASVMRATIWVLGAAATSCWNRKFRPSYIICISFILIPMLGPNFIKQAGFWLSFSAMAGIVFVYPGIKKLMLSLKIPRGFLDNHIISTILLTISIQLFCGPLILYYFKSLPLISPISSLLIMPFFYILILLLFTASAVCAIWPPAGGLVLKLVPFSAKPVCAISRFFSNPRFPSLEVDNIHTGKLLIYYFTILAVLFIIKIINAKRFDF